VTFEQLFFNGIGAQNCDLADILFSMHRRSLDGFRICPIKMKEQTEFI
jgi:hypothetical protein